MSKKLLSLAAIAPIALTLVATSAPANAASNSVPEKFTFNGAGWGHGVGMSQYGAYGMALDGYTAKQILEHYYNPAKLTNISSNADRDILVQLLAGQSKSTFSPKDGKLRVKVNGKTYESSKPVTFEVSGSNIAVTVEGKKYTSNGTAKIDVEWQNTRYWTSGGSNTTVSVPLANGGSGTGTYRHGKIHVQLLKGKLNILNSLRLNDEYLYGLAEVPSSWPEETLKAQAIAGRTYAMRNISSIKSACGCNVYDEVASQKFTGWSKENEANGAIGKKWVNAVNKTQTKKNGIPTSAQVVTYKGALIDAVYSSSTGGKTRSSKDVWGSNHDYLQSRDDHWALNPKTGNPNRAWSGTITQAQAASAYKLPNVEKITVKKNSDGTIYSSTAVSSSGQVSTLSASATRSLFKAKSTWVNNITGSGQELPATDSFTVTKVAANVKYKTTSNLNMRRGPNTSYSVITTASKDSEVVTTGRKSGSWIEVKHGSIEGWVSSAYLSKVNTPAPAPSKPKPAPTKPKPAPSKPAPAPSKSVSYSTTANLHLRAGAGTTHKSLTVLSKGAKVAGTGKTNGKWVEVKAGSRTGWVSSTYLKKTSTSTSGSNKPTVSAPKPTTSTSNQFKTTANLHLRAGAGTNHKSLTILNKGTTVTKTGKTSGKWAQIKAGNKTGWVSTTYLQANKTSNNNKPITTTKNTTKKTTANLNMRSGAGTGHKVVKTIPKGKNVKLTGKKSGQWVQVTYGGKTGWSSSQYMK